MFSCCSIGHKHCFSHDSIIMQENFGPQYYCDKIRSLRLSKQQRICSVAKKGQKRQAEKCYQILNIYPRYQLVIIFVWLFQREIEGNSEISIFGGSYWYKWNLLYYWNE